MGFPALVASKGGVNGPFIGPWLSPGGALYALSFGNGSVANSLSMFKSLDGGNTWALMDDPGSPGDAGLGAGFSGVLVGSVLWVANVNGSSANQVTPYNTTTDTWGATTATHNAETTLNYKAITYNSDGNLYIAGNVSAFFVGGKIRTGYYTFNISSLTFSNWTQMGETGASAYDWSCVSIVSGPIGEIDFISWANDSVSGAAQIWRQPYVSGLGAKVLIDSVVGGSLYAPSAFSDGTTAKIVWAGTSNNPLSAIVYSAPVSTWIFTTQTISIPATEYLVVGTSVVIGYGGTYVIAGSYSTSSETFGNVYVFNDAGGGFGLPVLLGAAPGPISNTTNSQMWTIGPIGNAVPWAVLFQVQGGTSNAGLYFWATTATTATTPQNPFRIQVVPFPQSNPCCFCPPLIGCVKCGPNGKMMITTKGQAFRG